jgi:hypothetical protein
MRKIIVGLCAIAFVGVFFLGYVLLTDTAPIQTPGAAQVQDINLPQSRGAGQQTTDTDVRDAREARYVVLNPDTKEVERVLGFEKMQNPGTESSRWEVEKPYLLFYESGYQCRIDSAKGIFQTQLNGSNAVPKDAQLSGNVVIHVIPDAGSRMSETVIKMDDLIFSSERSEFSTDGPVSVQSEQVQLEGFGLILIFDTAAGRIDYLNIRDLEMLRILNVSESEKATEAKAPTTSAQRRPSASSSVQPSGSLPRTIDDTSRSQETAASPSDYYECVFDENVEIAYGNELVVSGADQVNIQNIVFSSLDSGDRAANSPGSVDPDRGQKKNSGQRPQEPVTPPQVSDSAKEVLVRCDGGIILRPMPDETAEKTTSQTPELSVEMRGAPLSITRIQPDREPMISCGLLKYTPSEDVLRLFTQDGSPEIVLNAPNSKGRIQTLGNVWWDRKNQQANVAGPGKVYLENSDASTEPSEIAFNGAMDLLFAPPAGLSSSPAIQTINLTGGMNALLKQNGWYQTIADSAILEFGSENSLSQASLLGAVQFESMEKDNPQRAVADSATFEFGPRNTLTSAHMEGGVRFDSVRDRKPSYAQANAATFYFDQSKIRAADFKGAVRLASDTGKLTSSDVTIDFKPDAAGTMQPEGVRTESNAVLETVSGNAPPAKFEARKIDFDLLTGSGLAHGPVRFTFYQPADSNDTTADPWIPIVIMADESAQFIADESRTIRQIVFNGNVLATRRWQQAEFTQLDNFHGDRLTVFLGKDDTGRTGITRIRMTEGQVFAQSQRFKTEQVLLNVKLYCTELSYDRMNNVISAEGPGKIELVNNEHFQADGSSSNNMIGQPCVARVKKFGVLRWNMNDHNIVVDGQDDSMTLEYYPFLNSKIERMIFVSSMRFEFSYAINEDRETALQSIFTDQGIVFEEKNADRNQILHKVVGQTLKYDAVSDVDWLTITGSDVKPCYVDGNRVPKIHYNISTGEFKTNLSTIPGYIR